MKKKYEKPMFVVEPFQLDAAYAASCSSQNYIALNYGENSCGYGVSTSYKWQYFNYYNCEMDLTDSEGDGNDTICYHGPIDVGTTFINS